MACGLRPAALSGVLLVGSSVMQRSGSTAVLIENDGRIVGAIAVRDELRPEDKARMSNGVRAGRTQALPAAPASAPLVPVPA